MASRDKQQFSGVDSGGVLSRMYRQAGFLTLAQLFFIICMAVGVWKFMQPAAPQTAAPLTGEQIAALAAGVREGDVVMYTTTECPYCGQARSWLNGHGIAFKDCNMSNERSCARELDAHGGDGVPYLVVRGHHMRDGFDSDELLAALQK